MHSLMTTLLITRHNREGNRNEPLKDGNSLVDIEMHFTAPVAQVRTSLEEEITVVSTPVLQFWLTIQL